MKTLPHIPKIGMIIRINERPDSWSSMANGLCHLNKVTYPKLIKIKQISLGISGNWYSIQDDEGGGWSWNSLYDVAELVQTSMDLPEKWYIKGGSDLINFFKEIGADITGNSISAGYYNSGNVKNWAYEYSDNLKGYTEISIEEYKKYLASINSQPTQNLQSMQTTDKPKEERIIVLINKNNEIETLKDKLQITKVGIVKEVLITRSIKINGAERDLSVSVIVDTNWNIHAGYSVRNPKWDETHNPKLAKTVARNRAVNPKTNLLKNESIGMGLASKYVLKGISDQIFANVSKGSIEIKGVK